MAEFVTLSVIVLEAATSLTVYLRHI